MNPLHKSYLKDARACMFNETLSAQTNNKTVYIFYLDAAKKETK